jgi:hypothetical protein
MCQFSDKFYAAVRTLSGDGAIKTRLAAAYAENLELISEDEVPEIIRPRFDLLRREMHSAMPIGSESAVVASVRKMSLTDASGCANLIVAIFSELVRVKSTGERLNSRRDDAEQPTVGNGRDPATLN